jgi:hypothetical protein
LEFRGFGFLIFVCGGVVFASVERKDFDSKGLARLSVENGLGHVTVTVALDGKASVSATKKNFPEGCRLDFRKDGAVLVAHVKGPEGGLNKASQCEVDLDIRVPKPSDIDLLVGVGGVSIQGTHGKLAFKIGQGDLAAEGSFSSLEGRSGNGKVNVVGLSSGGSLQIGNGDAALTFGSTLGKGSLDLKMGNGNALVKFVKGTKVHAELHAGSGSLQNRFGDTPSAPFAVTMKAGLGNLTIEPY